MHILLVTGSPALATLVTVAARIVGVKVRIAQSFSLADVLLQAERFDLAIVAPHVPLVALDQEPETMAFLRSVRKHETGERIPLILLLGHSVPPPAEQELHDLHVAPFYVKEEVNLWDYVQTYAHA